jgi:hypothetical protein
LLEAGEDSMNCYDCSRAGHPQPAVAVCAACGAGVCLDCARIGHQTMHRMAGLVSAEVSDIETRVVNCPSCADAVHAHHRAGEGLVAH